MRGGLGKFGLYCTPRQQQVKLVVAYFEFKGQFRTLRKRKILSTFIIQPFPDIDAHFPSDRYGRLLAGVHRERGDVPHHPGLLCRIRQRGWVRVLQLGDWLLRRETICQGERWDNYCYCCFCCCCCLCSVVWMFQFHVSVSFFFS